ncbi:sulfatase-like hydrolase/transferase [Opitutia bacterium ISCC 51]|nr:sulfatase-like hydrolase/transferase [Opitutae bacterium ISCC 51]QXD29953.1 sulfatase-like hydrolase/transferase [Opitutae bacterium ISCC 52]
MRIYLHLFLFFLLPSFSLLAKTNLVIVMTDEHNFRTLGCYREHLSEDQAFVWGKGVKVDTPHMDALADEGALLTSFYVSSPVCSPSRAAFVTGLMPHLTGVPTNDIPMHGHMTTIADILGDNGYATSYIGKWHLDGVGKPQWEPERNFGWADNRFMFNRGHYKKFAETHDGAKVDAPKGRDGIPGYQVGDADEKSYATDFLMDRTLDFIRKNQDDPFCVMLSLPDPHGPNTVREPYWDKYKGLKFEAPKTMFKTEEEAPGWSSFSGNNYIKNREINQDQFAAIFGMIECIDDNIGRLIAELDKLGLEDDTIVVLTSDHGDLMGEHRRHNKGVPFEGSAKVPFLVKSPKQVKAGKVIHSVMTSVDVGPTFLSMLGIEDELPGTQGRDRSDWFENSKQVVDEDHIAYIRATTMSPPWVAAVSDDYKLVLSNQDSPWLFDLKKDPDELINFYDHKAYKRIRESMTQALKEEMKKANEPALTMSGYAPWLN